jgi:hypothetical protein
VTGFDGDDGRGHKRRLVADQKHDRIGALAEFGESLLKLAARGERGIWRLGTVKRCVKTRHRG